MLLGLICCHVPSSLPSPSSHPQKKVWEKQISSHTFCAIGIRRHFTPTLTGEVFTQHVSISCSTHASGSCQQAPFPGASLAVDGGYRSIFMSGRKQHPLLPGIAVKRPREHGLGSIYRTNWCLELLLLGHLQKSSHHVLIVWFWFSPAVNVTKSVCNTDHPYSRKSCALSIKAGCL